MPHSRRCVIMRGGTSKAVFLKEADIPADPEARHRLTLAVYASPDRRPIDSLGGADPPARKLAVIGPSRETLPRAAGTHILAYALGQPFVVDTRAAVAQALDNAALDNAGPGQRITSRRHVPRYATPAEPAAFLPQQLADSNKRVRLAGIEPQ